MMRRDSISSLTTLCRYHFRLKDRSFVITDGCDLVPGVSTIRDKSQCRDKRLRGTLESSLASTRTTNQSTSACVLTHHAILSVARSPSTWSGCPATGPRRPGRSESSAVGPAVIRREISRCGHSGSWSNCRRANSGLARRAIVVSIITIRLRSKVRSNSRSCHVSWTFLRPPALSTPKLYFFRCARALQGRLRTL
jgi:hypothetical protein